MLNLYCFAGDNQTPEGWGERLRDQACPRGLVLDLVDPKDGREAGFELPGSVTVTLFGEDPILGEIRSDEGTLYVSYPYPVEREASGRCRLRVEAVLDPSESPEHVVSASRQILLVLNRGAPYYEIQTGSDALLLSIQTPWQESDGELVPNASVVFLATSGAALAIGPGPRDIHKSWQRCEDRLSKAALDLIRRRTFHRVFDTG